MRPARHEILTTSFAACVVLSGCTTELSSDLDEGQADEVVLALDEAGIGAQKERGASDGRYSVLVTRADLAPALSVLHDRALPREEPPGLEALFRERGLVPSASEERARASAAVAGELARSIESMDGVQRARVHLAMPEPGGRLLDDAPARARASVLITAARGAPVDDRAIRALVAGAVTDLAPDDVAVVRTDAPRPSARERQLVTIGPIAVTRGSADALKALLAGSFALNLVLAAALVLARARRRDAPRGHQSAAENTTG